MTPNFEMTSDEMKARRCLRSGLYRVADSGCLLRIGPVATDDGNRIQWQIEDEDGSIMEWGDWSYDSNADAFWSFLESNSKWGHEAKRTKVGARPTALD